MGVSPSFHVNVFYLVRSRGGQDWWKRFAEFVTLFKVELDRVWSTIGFGEVIEFMSDGE